MHWYVPYFSKQYNLNDSYTDGSITMANSNLGNSIDSLRKQVFMGSWGIFFLFYHEFMYSLESPYRTFCQVRPTKTQINLRFHAVWSEFPLSI